MGQLRFVVPQRDRLPEEALKRVYLSGMEGIPWRCTNSWLDAPQDSSQRGFVVERSVPDSGNLFVPWNVGGREIMLSTATLMEREQPYNLPVELARGLLNRLRNQSADWQMIGLTLPSEFLVSLRDASRSFVQATTASATEEAAAACAEQAIRQAMTSLDSLVSGYISQAVAARQQQSAQLPTLFGVQLCHRKLVDAETALLPAALNTVSVSVCWRDLEKTAGKKEWQTLDEQIEWCREAGFRIIGGPLLQLQDRDVPDWLYLWEDDFDQVQSYVIQHIRSIVKRFRGKVHIWNCAARINVPDALSLGEEQKLRLVVNAIEEVRREDPSTPLILGVDRPWAEHLASEDLDLSPLHFADSLLRADLGIAGIGLEVNLGYWPDGTLPRDLLEFSRMLDRWSLLDIPLIIYLTVPSDVEPPDGALGSTIVPLSSFAGGATLETQKVETQDLVQLMLAKHFVQGVIWNQLCDADDPRYAHSGLFDTQFRPKPIIEALTSIRKQHLN